MKKIIYSFALFIFCAKIADANVVLSETAQSVAANFYSQNTQKKTVSAALVYTERSDAGDPVYYAYNINGKEGFVIVSAEDAGLPIIGYSTEGSFIAPSETSNPEFNYWMQKRKTEIVAMRSQNVISNAEISAQWNDYANNKIHTPTVMSTVHPQLCKTTWDQNSGGSIPYNYYCPGGSLTGCVATAMAQIMKYWSYPAQGAGSSSYYASTYGTLSCDYGVTTYNWANMPLTSSNADVALISYQCGVSVDMNYSTTASGAYVCGGNPSAEYSYVNYFNYDPNIHCEYQNAHTTAQWNQMLEDEFAAGRPVQYQGTDATKGGHTWVADGNDANDMIHMNWGWGGVSNGNFAVTSLTPPGYTFNTSDGGLFGIKPVTNSSLDAGTFSFSSPTGTSCNTTFTPVVTIKNFGSSTLTSCTIKYHVDGNADLTYHWNGSLMSYLSTDVTLPSITVTPGAHTFTSATSLPNGSADLYTVNDQLQTNFNIISNTASIQAPYSEGFENSGFPYADNYVSTSTGAVWSPTNTAAATGTYSLKLDNYSATSGDVDEFITPAIDMSTVKNQMMTFKVAHAQRNASDLDQLVVFSSTNCGNLWIQRYIRSGVSLNTGGGVVSSAFTPTAGQWRKDTVNIASITGQKDVRFKFQFTSSGSGNNIYIDDINVTGTPTGISEEYENGFGLEVFPNPLSDQTTISFNLNDQASVAVGVYDIIGKEVVAISNKSELTAGSYTIPFNKGSLRQGIYFVKLDVNGYSLMKKVIIQ